MVSWTRSTLVILVAILSVLLFHPPAAIGDRGTVSASSQPLGPSSHRTYWLRGGPGSSNWNGTLPGPGLNASDGDTVTIMLQSVDGVTHSWFLDFNNNLGNDTNEAPTVSPDFRSTTAWSNFTFTASLGTVIPHGGTFTYECRQHPRFMNGNFRFYAGPVASFTHSPSTPLVGHVVAFDGSSSWPTTDSTITNYSWSFGDGNTTSSGSSSTTTHKYGTNGTFTVVLTITDGASQTGQATGNVTIIPSTGFDYRITISTANTDIAAGLTAIISVNITIVSGTPENVSLTAGVSPSRATVHASLNVSSGFPTFHAALSVTTETTSLCDPSQTSVCNLLSRVLYSVKIIGVSSTGVTHNSTVVLNIIAGPHTYPPFPLLPIIGAALAVALLVVFIVVRSRRKANRSGPVLD